MSKHYLQVTLTNGQFDGQIICTDSGNCGNPAGDCLYAKIWETEFEFETLRTKDQELFLGDLELELDDSNQSEPWLDVVNIEEFKKNGNTNGA